MRQTTCCVIGGGPAGMVLGLLLARAGVDVTVLEKHGDFLRDFRGDTVHPTTLALIDELGLRERFDQLPHRRVQQVRLPIGPEGEFVTLADLSALKGNRNYIAMVPQWDFLDLLADAGRQEPTFTLRMETEAVALIRERGRVNGVRFRTGDGTTGELRATITVACDGRDSIARDLPDIRLRDFSTPLDVWWFRLPRLPDDPEGVIGKVSHGMFMLLIDRGDYFQTASIIAKGTDAVSRARPVEELNRSVTDMLPWLAGRELVRTRDEVKLLHVKLDRMRRWQVPGLLCIGDAAHAMSPVGGVGINLAVQDAVAAARHLAEPLRNRTLRRAHVVAIQRRRWLTTMLIQRFQRAVHDHVVGPALAGKIDFTDRTRLPLVLRIANRLPRTRRLPAYLFGYGAMRERPPDAALRG